MVKLKKKLLLAFLLDAEIKLPQVENSFSYEWADRTLFLGTGHQTAILPALEREFCILDLFKKKLSVHVLSRQPVSIRHIYKCQSLQSWEDTHLVGTSLHRSG